MFHVTPDHKYIVWFSAKKTAEETRIKIKNLLQVQTGSASMLADKLKKDKDLLDTAISIYYGKSLEKKKHQVLNVVAKNKKEAIIWSNGLMMLCHRGKVLVPGESSYMINMEFLEDFAFVDDITDGKADEVINVNNLEIKDKDLTSTKLLKEHMKCKQRLQKCIDFVMTKANYRAIAEKGQFDRVKLKLEDLDNRLTDERSRLTNLDASLSKEECKKELLEIATKLWRCDNEIEALMNQLIAIVRVKMKHY